MKKYLLILFLYSLTVQSQSVYKFTNATNNNVWDQAPNWVKQSGPGPLNAVPGPGDDAIIDVSSILASPGAGGISNFLTIPSTANCKSFSLTTMVAGKGMQINGSLDVYGNFDLSGSFSFSVQGTGIAFKGTGSTYTVNTAYTTRSNLLNLAGGIAFYGNYILADHLHDEVFGDFQVGFQEGCNFNSNNKDIVSYGIGSYMIAGVATNVNLSNSKLVSTYFNIVNNSPLPINLNLNGSRVVLTDSIPTIANTSFWPMLGLAFIGPAASTSTIQSLVYHYYSPNYLNIGYGPSEGKTNLVSTMPQVTFNQIKTINNLYMSSSFTNPIDKMEINDFVFERGATCDFEYNIYYVSPYKIGKLRSSGKCDSIVYLKNYRGGFCQVQLELVNNCTVNNFAFSDIKITGAGNLTANNSYDLGGNGGNLTITSPIPRTLLWRGSGITNSWNDPLNWFNVTASAIASCPPSPADSVILDYSLTTGAIKSAYIEPSSYCGGMLVRGQSIGQTFTVTGHPTNVNTLTNTKGLYIGYTAPITVVPPTETFVNWNANAVLNFTSSKRNNGIATQGILFPNTQQVNFSGQGKWNFITDFKATNALLRVQQGHLEFGYFPYPNDFLTASFSNAAWIGPYRTTLIDSRGDRRDTITLNRVKLVLKAPYAGYNNELDVRNYYQTLKVTNGMDATDRSEIISNSIADGVSFVIEGPYVDILNTPCLEFWNFKTLNPSRNYNIRARYKQAASSSTYNVKFNKITNVSKLNFYNESIYLPYPDGSNLTVDSLDVSSGQAVTFMSPASLTTPSNQRNSIIINKSIVTSSLCTGAYGILNSSDPSIPADIKVPNTFTMQPTRLNIQNMTVNAFGSGLPLAGYTTSITSTSSLKSGITTGWITTNGTPRLFYWNGEGLGDASNPITINNANWNNARNWNISNLNPASLPAFSAVLGANNIPLGGVNDDPNSLFNPGACIPGPYDSVVFVNTSFPSPATYTVNIDSTNWANTIHWNTSLSNVITWKNTVNGNLNINSSLLFDNSVLAANVFTCQTNFWASDNNNFLKNSSRILRTTLVFNTPGTWNLLDSLMLQSTYFVMLPGIYHKQGSIITNGHNLNISSYYSPTSAVRMFDIQNSRVICNHFGGMNFASFTQEIHINSDNFTLKASGSKIYISGVSNSTYWYSCLTTFGSKGLEFNDIYYQPYAGTSGGIYGYYTNSSTATNTINTLWSDVDNFNVTGNNIIKTLRLKQYSTNTFEKSKTQLVDSLIAISQNCSGSAYIKSSQVGVNAKLHESSGNAAFKTVNFNIEDIESNTSPTYALTGDADALGLTSSIKSNAITYTNVNGWQKSSKLVTYDFGFDTLFLNCNNPISLYATNFLANPDSYYEWKRETSPGVFTAITSSLSSQDSIIAKLPGRYYCKVTYINPTCFAQDTVYVKFTNNITSSFTITPVSCNSGTNGAISYSLTGGVPTGTALAHYYQYNWLSGGVSSTSTSTLLNVFNSIYSGLSAGVYTVTMLDTTASVSTASLSACKLVQTFTINPVSPLVLSASSSSVACYSYSTGVLTGSASGSNPSYTYTWTNGTSTYTTASVSGVTAGIYTITVTDTKSCTTTTTVNVGTPPSAITSTLVGFSDVLCNGGTSGSATVTASGGTGTPSFTWTPIGGSTGTATALSNGSYTVNITDENGCSTSKTVSISQPTAGLSVLSLNSNSVLCSGTASGSASLTATGGTPSYTVSWSGPSSYTYTSTGATSSITVGAGTYSAIITDANGCATNTTAVVTEPTASVSVALTGTISPTNCTSNTGIANVNASGGTSSGYIYTWINSAGTNTTSTATNTMLPIGITTVTIVDANSCASNTITINVTAAGAPIVALTTTSVLCNGGSGSASANVTGIAPFNYTWESSTSVTNNSGTLVAGTYTVLVSETTTGCKTIETFTISEPTVLSTAISNIINVNCFGGATGSASVTPSGGTASYTYNWLPTGGSTNTGTGLTQGTYTVTVTDANNCAKTNTVQILGISTDMSIAITDTIKPGCGNLSNGLITVGVTGGTPIYTYLWNNGVSLPTNANIPNASYTVIVTDANNCSKQLEITLDCFTALFIPEIFSPNGDGKNDKFEIKGIYNYPNNNLKIFNRWGGLVYQKNNYANDWDGRPNIATSTGKELLPAGTYYVIFDFGDNKTKTYNGFVQLEY